MADVRTSKYDPATYQYKRLRQTTRGNACSALENRLQDVVPAYVPRTFLNTGNPKWDELWTKQARLTEHIEILKNPESSVTIRLLVLQQINADFPGLRGGRRPAHHGGHYSSDYDRSALAQRTYASGEEDARPSTQQRNDTPTLSVRLRTDQRAASVNLVSCYGHDSITARLGTQITSDADPDSVTVRPRPEEDRKSIIIEISSDEDEPPMKAESTDAGRETITHGLPTSFPAWPAWDSRTDLNASLGQSTSSSPTLPKFHTMTSPTESSLGNVRSGREASLGSSPPTLLTRDEFLAARRSLPKVKTNPATTSSGKAADRGSNRGSSRRAR